MKNKKLRIGILYSVIFILLVELDLFTKRIAVLSFSNKPMVLIDKVLEFTYLENKGAAFSLLNNAQWFFILITAIFIVAAIWFFIKIPVDKSYRILRILLLFIAAGAAGNFIDRLTLGYVRDFIYVSIINFPVFNVADIYITVAVFILFVYIIFTKEDFSFLKSERKKDID